MRHVIQQLFVWTMIVWGFGENQVYAQQATNEAGVPNRPVDFVILPVKELKLLKDAQDAKQDAPLSQTDLLEVEHLLEQSIDEYYGRPNVIKLLDYKTQYFCAINEQGQKIVWVNCYCNDICFDASWKHHALLVNDGGNCVLKLKINLNAKHHYGLGVNGLG